MYLRADSAAGVRFLSSVREGRGLKASARAAGVGKETGYRWLREAFLVLRSQGVGVDETQSQLGYRSPLVQGWECDWLARDGDGRHHLAVPVSVEELHDVVASRLSIGLRHVSPVLLSADRCPLRQHPAVVVHGFVLVWFPIGVAVALVEPAGVDVVTVNVDLE